MNYIFKPGVLKYFPLVICFPKTDLLSYLFSFVLQVTFVMQLLICSEQPLEALYKALWNKPPAIAQRKLRQQME